jgi:hypothetical protein
MDAHYSTDHKNGYPTLLDSRLLKSPVALSGTSRKRV